jgi:hypothetical protein
VSSSPQWRSFLDHFTAVHGWPLTTEERAGKSFDIVLRDGFNIVATADGDGRNQQRTCSC